MGYTNCGCKGNSCSCGSNRRVIKGNMGASQIVVPVPGDKGDPGVDGDTYVPELTDNFFDV